jgi:hypothetical protein
MIKIPRIVLHAAFRASINMKLSRRPKGRTEQHGRLSLAGLNTCLNLVLPAWALKIHGLCEGYHGCWRQPQICIDTDRDSGGHASPQSRFQCASLKVTAGKARALCRPEGSGAVSTGKAGRTRCTIREYNGRW